MEPLVQRPADVGPRHRDGLVVQGAERLLEGAVIEGKGALEEGLASEGDQADAAAPVALDVIQNGELGPLQAAGRDIRGQHAARAIQHEDHVLAQQVAGIGALAPLGPGQGQADPRHRQYEQPVLDLAADGAVGGGQLLHELWRGDARQVPPPHPRRIPLQGQQRHRPQRRQPHPVRLGKVRVNQGRGHLSAECGVRSAECGPWGRVMENGGDDGRSNDE